MERPIWIAAGSVEKDTCFCFMAMTVPRKTDTAVFAKLGEVLAFHVDNFLKRYTALLRKDRRRIARIGVQGRDQREKARVWCRTDTLRHAQDYVIF